VNDKVCAITLNLNQNEYSIKCVESLLKTDYKNLLILLIDNGSTNNNYQELRNGLPKDDRIILHRLEKNLGYVGGINYGLRESLRIKPDYYLIMNNDTIIDSEAIKELVNCCKRYDNKAIITGKIFYYNNPTIIQTVGNKFKNKRTFEIHMVGNGEKDVGQYDKEEERDMIDDIFWLFPAKLFEVIGYYSAWYGFGFEQADFAQKAKNNDYKLIYTPKAKLQHKINATVGHDIRTPYKAFWSIQGHLMFKWSYISKDAFIKSYFLTSLEILSAFRYDILHIFNKKIDRRFAYAKLIGFLRFHLWTILKMPCDRYIPKRLIFK
jgi:hypothetical protein